MSKRSLLQSFEYSLTGFLHALDSERNLRVHALIGALAVGLGIVFDISRPEWLVLVLTIGVVLALELTNTALEYMLDELVKYHHPKIKIIKDVMAASVLIAAFGALIIGLIIFIPKIFGLEFE